MTVLYRRYVNEVFSEGETYPKIIAGDHEVSRIQVTYLGISKLTLVFHHPPSVSLKQMSVPAHLGCTR